jgi:hypothetical protein
MQVNTSFAALVYRIPFLIAMNLALALIMAA